MQESIPAVPTAASTIPVDNPTSDFSKFTRFGSFNRDELEAIQGSLAATVDVIMRCAADATHEVCRNPDAAHAAADMLSTAGTLAMEISDLLGEEHPPAETLAAIVERVRVMAILDLLPEGGG